MKKDILLFVGYIPPYTFDIIKTYNKTQKHPYRIGLFCDDTQLKDPRVIKNIKNVDVVISCDTHTPQAIQEAVYPYRKQLKAVTCRAEDQMPLFSRLIPFVPYLRTPSSESILWSSNKLLMRRRFASYSKKLSPPYTVVADTTKKTIQAIEKKVPYPMIVKPAGLAASRLVSMCFHREELQSVLKQVFKNAQSVYKKNRFTQKPKVLVEAFMEGKMYSIDAYVNATGDIFYCPPVYITTGKEIGFDDFFGYRQILPVNLSEENIGTAHQATEDAIYALGLKNTSVHIELMKTEQGWKVIELGARLGGFRHKLYSASHGINHVLNDLRIRMGKKPIIPKKQIGAAAAMKFFAEKEGKLSKLTGIKKIQSIKSIKELSVFKKIGDMCRFAKHGGSNVFSVILSAKTKPDLLADIRRIEQSVSIQTKK